MAVTREVLGVRQIGMPKCLIKQVRPLLRAQLP